MSDEKDIVRIRSRLVEDANGCWNWTGYFSGGYGRVRLRGPSRQAHRAMYELLIGSIPEGLHLDHLCRNRACCNPAHLEPVTNRENVLRGEGRPAVNAKKTACPDGHPYSGDNLYVDPSGRRHCRTCLRAADARYRPSRKAKRSALKEQGV